MGKAVAVNLPENLTIACAEPLYADLDQYVHGVQDVVLTGGSITRADTAGLQLLCAFMAAMAKNNAKVGWSSTSAALVEAAQQLGLSDRLALNSL